MQVNHGGFSIICENIYLKVSKTAKEFSVFFALSKRFKVILSKEIVGGGGGWGWDILQDLFFIYFAENSQV